MKFVVGTKVILNGHKGTVTRIVPWDKKLREVRLPGGISCVSVSELKYYRENKPVSSKTKSGTYTDDKCSFCGKYGKVKKYKEYKLCRDCYYSAVGKYSKSMNY